MMLFATGAVHMVGGVAGLAGAWVAGPRLGRFDSNGKPQPIPGHNAVYYTMGEQPCPLLLRITSTFALASTQSVEAKMAI